MNQKENRKNSDQRPYFFILPPYLQGTPKIDELKDGDFQHERDAVIIGLLNSRLKESAKKK
jgi:hypothetical protein